MSTQIYTCDEAKERLKKALDALDRTLEAQKYTVENSRNSQRMVERASLTQLTANVERWEAIVASVCTDDGCVLDMKQGLPPR